VKEHYSSSSPEPLVVFPEHEGLVSKALETVEIWYQGSEKTLSFPFQPYHRRLLYQEISKK
jgi:hypothetical protein